jgi:hypothetical protein
MPINSPTGFLDITNATLRTSNLEAENLLITGGNIYVTSELEADATVLNLENVTRKGNVSSNTIEITNATTGIVATGNVHALKFIGSGSHLTGIPPTAITGTLSQWSDGANSDVYIASNVGIGNVHTLTSNTLQVGGNLYVRDTDANVLTVNGNVVASYFEGDGSRLSGIVTDLQGVTDNGNVTTNVVQFSNATTGLVTTANIEVGGDIKVVGLSAGTVPYVASDKFLKDSFITMTGDATVITSNLDVTGNIFMRGNKFIVESETKLINDAIIGIANNNASSTTDKGIIMQNDPSNANGNVAIIHHGAGDGFADQLTFGYTADPLDTLTVTNDLTKELTVNVIGNVITQNNLSVGGTLNINTISAASSHSLQAVTNLGNVTSNTVQFSNAITSLVASSNIVATGNVSAGHDTDTTSYFGRAAVGYITGASDQASFAHFERNSTAQYALKQAATGETSINTPANKHIRFAVNDVDKMRITSAGKVGIGAILPDATLHVEGNAYVSSNLTVGGNVETKNINMLHTANTAAIKLNSNVVTEFSRSKKLIKYPRVALTANSSGGYVAGRSTVYTNSAGLEAWKMFDGEASTYWHSEDSTGYWNSDGTYDGSSELITGHLGEWVTLELPTNEKVQLHGIRVFPRGLRSTYSAGAAPKDVVVIGSDGGSSWNVIASTTLTGYRFGTNPSTSTPDYEEYIPVEFFFQTNKYYQHVGLIIKSLHAGSHTHASISNLEFLGTPEYDPETHGTNVNFKTEMNTPTTDGLNVYYDAKNFVSGSVTVQDETSNNRDAEMNATFDNGQIKAFDFSGAYTSNVTTSDHGLGTDDVQFSLAMWLYRKSKSGGATHDYVVQMGTGGTSYQSILVWIYNDQINFDAWSAAVRYDEIIRNDTWYHFVLTHNGGSVPSSVNTVMYVNGRPIKPSAPGGEATRLHGSPATRKNNPFNLQGSKLTLGSEHNGTTEYFNGKIANFRLYNRVINSEEATHLYNFQKEEFGHGVNTLTLKDGCLGIGTDKPRAALDYHGERRVYGMEIPTFSVTKNTDVNVPDGSGYVTTSGNYIYFNHANVNRGGHYTFDDGRFTAPLAGCYHFSFFGMTYGNLSCGVELRKNGEGVGNSENTSSSSNGCWPFSEATGATNHNQVHGTVIMFLHPGDYVQVYISHGNVYTGHNAHNQFSGFYIG